VCTTSVRTIGWVERGESTLAFVARAGFLASPSEPLPSQVSRGEEKKGEGDFRKGVPQCTHTEVLS